MSRTVAVILAWCIAYGACVAAYYGTRSSRRAGDTFSGPLMFYGFAVIVILMAVAVTLSYD